VAHSVDCPGQAFPHDPQFAGSVWNVAESRQTLPQQTPASQSAVSSHGPPSRDGPAAQEPFTQMPEQHPVFTVQGCSVPAQQGSQLTWRPQLSSCGPHLSTQVTARSSGRQQADW